MQNGNQLKSIAGDNNKKVIRDFERNNPGLAALFAQKEQEEMEQMRQIMKEPDRMERWKKMAKITHDADWAARRRREVMWKER